MTLARPRLIPSPLRPPCNFISSSIQIRQAGCRSLPHHEGPNLGKSLLVSRRNYQRAIISLPLNQPGVHNPGICRVHTSTIGAVCGKNARWIAVPAAPIFISNSGQIVSGLPRSIFIDKQLQRSAGAIKAGGGVCVHST